MAKVAVIKTKLTGQSVEDFINKIPDEQKRKDSFVLLDLMKKITKEEPKLWSNSTIGFGLKRYKSERSGREVDWFSMGFSPRKANLSLHLITNMDTHAEAFKKLGKYKTGVGCIYINKLDDVDIDVLEQIINASAKS